MKIRIFSVVALVLCLVVAGTSVLKRELFRREKLALIDTQVRETATALVDSELSEIRKIDFEEVDAVISKELGQNRLGKFFVIRNNAGDLLFESASARLLSMRPIPRSPRWITAHEQGKYIRILNLQLPSIEDRTLQVGLASNNEDMLSAPYFFNWYLPLLLAIVAAGLALVWVMVAFLTRPFSELSRFMRTTSENFGATATVSSPPQQLQRLAHSPVSPHDEIGTVLERLDVLIESVNQDYRLSLISSWQMIQRTQKRLAHLASSGASQQDLTAGLRDLAFSTSEFLKRVEADEEATDLSPRAYQVSPILFDLVKDLDMPERGRLEIWIKDDFSVVNGGQDIRQIVESLLSNALRFSPASKSVKIEVAHGEIRITDAGPGLPVEVMNDLGEPFNRGPNNAQAPGEGLGLALAFSIARAHGWELSFKRRSGATVVTLKLITVTAEEPRLALMDL